MRADMSPARCHEPAALVPSSLLVVLITAPGAEGCNATCQRDFTCCMARHCGAGVGGEACWRRCKPAAIRTLAYVVSECREDAAGMEVGRQALRTRRGDREPITVVVFGPFAPMPDPQGLCRQYGESRDGTVSVLTARLQRLAVRPEGRASCSR